LGVDVEVADDDNRRELQYMVIGAMATDQGTYGGGWLGVGIGNWEMVECPLLELDLTAACCKSAEQRKRGIKQSRRNMLGCA
jgi:hypothetical protein